MRKPTEPSKNPARENLASMLKDLRSRKKQLQPLARDYWIIINSEIEPQKLHALGVITFRWNLCEQKLLALFGSILDCPIEETHVLALELSGPALIARIRLLASTRLKGDDQLIASILNALDVFDVCRRNRNQLTHFGLTLESTGGEPRLRLGLGRKTRSPVYRKTEKFPDDIKDLRRVARDIRRLNDQLYKIERRVFAKFNSLKFPTATPREKLPIPELLWNPAPQPAQKGRAIRRP